MTEPTPDTPESEHPETTCQDCGRPNPVWFAPNDLWNAVRPEGGIICPSCFAAQAEVRGHVPTGWSFTPESELTGDGLRAAIEAVKGQHRRGDWTEEGWIDDDRGIECSGCSERWPCSAARLAALPNREAAPEGGLDVEPRCGSCQTPGALRGRPNASVHPAGPMTHEPLSE